MTVHLASLINAISLVGLGLWAYLGSEDPSPTALIPVVIGVILLALYPGVKNHNKVLSHVAVVLTLIILIGLAMPLKGAIGRDDSMGIGRVIVMMVTTLIAMVFFIRSFIEAKKKRTRG